MKILIFAGYFYPHRGGSEDYIYRLAKGLVFRGHKIDVVTTNSEKVLTLEKKDGINIYRLDCWSAVNKKYPIIKINMKNFQLLKNLLKNKYDFINTHTRFWFTSLLGILYATMNHVKLIHVEHGTVHTEIDNKFVGLINNLVDHTLGTLIVRRASIRIGVSDAAIEFMQHLGKRGDMKISKGLDIKKFEGKHKKPEKIIIYVGRLIYAKGIHDLIVAFSKIEDENYKLLIVGDGDYCQELRKLVKELSISMRVIFTGEKKGDEVIKYLKSAEILVNPSYSEGLPTTVLEAGAVGLPVIATDVGGTREVITNGETGLLIKPKDPKELTKSINNLIKNKSLANNLGKNLNILVRRDYNYENMINKFEEVYKNIK